ncbi:Rieske family iron-sulfur cluster-binding protein [Streptomyces himastatinicus ATCC 53653]|uniref:Rieske family iron-sulfur cluster-binding protein n=1 Tax=Streptomyces himastatinicus ATCC 53653 TaxID=457427 RepID=D9WWF8_9ACTN|nr:aromatic ring-hydroxylating dioxygenase subunit alpha [Streptomyces himastatinicus]EFL26614.1 Rieske family iron-sulfur cluster-binding protein [Streptomyces himastatinicus ATCC 53653]
MSIVTTSDSTQDAVARRAVGHSLEGPFYTDREFYALDLAAIFTRQWLFVAVDAEIPWPGDYTTVDIGPYPVIVLRDDEGNPRAFHNVCRHRGARLLEDRSGSVGNLVCGYHKWTYGTDGALRYAPSQPGDFDRGCFGLKAVHVRSVGGLLFVCLADDPPADFGEVAARIEPYLLPHRLRGAKVAARTDLVEDGNWKLVMENNRECYHCDGHPELLRTFFPTYGYAEEDIPAPLRPAHERYLRTDAELRATYERLGLPYALIEELDGRTTGFRIQRDALDLAGESFTPDGTAACRRLLGDLPTPRLGHLALHLHPNSWFHVLGDHAITFSALPLAPDRTLLRTTWLVHPDAEEGVDYDRDTLLKVWTATNEQDARLVARAQRGVSSPAYVPGPYAPTEYQVEAFCSWYIARLREELRLREGLRP